MATTTSTQSALTNLNQAQCQAVTSRAKTVAILAGPGSGKTHTLTSRAVWLIDHVGYKPEDVIVATFTVKAAREMKERIGKALGDGRERKIILGTFHSVARRYLAAYGTRVGLGQEVRYSRRDRLAEYHPTDHHEAETGRGPAGRARVDQQAESEGDGRCCTGETGYHQSPNEAELLRCYAEYQDQLARSNLLDYDDLLVRCVDLLRAYPSCVSNIQAVLIDEYQDTNGVQYELMKLFAQAQNRITVVGDPDQSIYGWRSAEVKNLHRLLADYRGTHRVSLEENYRSSERIVSVSLSVIQQDEERYQKILKPTHNKGSRPVLRKLEDSGKEADWIVAEMRRGITMMGNVITHDDVAILLRSASLSRHIESALGRAGIPYRMVGGFKFYERAEIKILLDYLRVVYQPHNNDALVRIVNVPRRGFGEATVKALVDEAETTGRSLWTLLVQHCRGDRMARANVSKKAELAFSGDLMRKIERLRDKMERDQEGGSPNLEELIEELLDLLRFQNYLDDTYGPESELRWANVQEFLTLAKDFMRELETEEEDTLPEIDGLEQVTDTDVLGRFLSNVSLATDVQTEEKESRPQVTISTIHAAKGLEWPVVFIPSVFDGMMPHGRTEDPDEERRLLYVAMTRAKAFLYLSHPVKNARRDAVQLSPFLPTKVAAGFARRGPSFQRTVLEEAGRILGRAVPSDGEVYAGVPPMFCPEDDAFPLDPEQPDGNGGGGGDAGGQRRAKRQRTQQGYPQRDAGEPQWQRGYATTMEQAAFFSVPAGAGFVSAGAHQAAILEAAQAEAAVAADLGVEKLAEKKKRVAKGTTQRPPNQTSMLGFLTGGRKASPEPKPVSAVVVLARSMSAPAAKAPIIAAELAGHRLARQKSLPKPAAPPSRDEGAHPAHHYAHFSSSPPRPRVWVDEKAPAKVEAKPAPVAAVRPATTMHKTTMSAIWTNGVRKPLGLRRDAPATMNVLTKPFKPLTMNRL